MKFEFVLCFDIPRLNEFIRAGCFEFLSRLVFFKLDKPRWDFDHPQSLTNPKISKASALVI